uniref:NFATC2-interacting protein isoform X2 n=1 Tax=Doryrhamphus excisus TaxID=161450 RepID=UPI0025AE74DF|nr:NFATC2-interacting protein isoform X2 [Doryrhamphus excisus]
MADALSDSEVSVAKPVPKRRRILDPSAIVPVPVYSNKVNSSLSLKAELPALTGKDDDDDGGGGGGDGLWLEMWGGATRGAAIVLSDSEEEQEVQLVDDSRDKPGSRSLSPPPPPAEIPVQKQSRNIQKKINEVDRKLRAINAALSPEGRDVGLRRRRRGIPEEDQDDVVIVEAEPRDGRAQEWRLKVRCRTDVYKLPVLSTTCVGEVASQLSAILQVPRHRLLLLREEAELPGHASLGELGLGIADILGRSCDTPPPPPVLLRGLDCRWLCRVCCHGDGAARRHHGGGARLRLFAVRVIDARRRCQKGGVSL